VRCGAGFLSAASRGADGGDPLGLAIVVDGAEWDCGELLSLEVWAAANQIPRARIVIHDGAWDNAEFPLSSSKTFAPGASIEISAGYDFPLSVIHKGTIVRHSIRVAPASPPELIIETADPLAAAVGPAACDRDIAAGPVSAARRAAARNEPVAAPQEASLRHDVSGWDLILARAEASGCIVLIEAGEALVVPPTLESEPVIDLVCGESVVSFDGTIDGTAERADYAVGRMQGTVTFQGSALAKPGSVVRLSGLGGRFNGKAFVGGVYHEVRDGAWRTTAQLGLAGGRIGRG
jgi:hypothetical protein